MTKYHNTRHIIALTAILSILFLGIFATGVYSGQTEGLFSLGSIFKTKSTISTTNNNTNSTLDLNATTITTCQDVTKPGLYYLEFKEANQTPNCIIIKSSYVTIVNNSQNNPKINIDSSMNTPLKSITLKNSYLNNFKVNYVTNLVLDNTIISGKMELNNTSAKILPKITTLGQSKYGESIDLNLLNSTLTLTHKNNYYLSVGLSADNSKINILDNNELYLYVTNNFKNSELNLNNNKKIGFKYSNYNSDNASKIYITNNKIVTMDDIYTCSSNFSILNNYIKSIGKLYFNGAMGCSTNTLKDIIVIKDNNFDFSIDLEYNSSKSNLFIQNNNFNINANTGAGYAGLFIRGIESSTYNQNYNSYTYIQNNKIKIYNDYEIMDTVGLMYTTLGQSKKLTDPNTHFVKINNNDINNTKEGIYLRTDLKADLNYNKLTKDTISNSNIEISNNTITNTEYSIVILGQDTYNNTTSKLNVCTQNNLTYFKDKSPFMSPEDKQLVYIQNLKKDIIKTTGKTINNCNK